MKGFCCGWVSPVLDCSVKMVLAYSIRYVGEAPQYHGQCIRFLLPSFFVACCGLEKSLLHGVCLSMHLRSFL